MLLVFFLFMSIAIEMLYCDLQFYENSITSMDPGSNLNLEIPYVAHNTISINSNQFSGTMDTLYVTYIGDFSSSGPHPIKNLENPSSVVTHSISLDRTIGQLQSLWIENQGYDALLLSSWEIRIRENIYQIATQDIWLESYDALQANQTGDGFSPYADIKIPSSPTLLLPVKSTLLYYTEIGINTDN